MEGFRIVSLNVKNHPILGTNDFTFYDGTTGNGTQVLKLFVKASDNGQSTDVINLTQALKIKHNAGLHVALDSSNTDYSMLINYYHSNTR